MQLFISNVSRMPHTRSLRNTARGVKPRRVFMLGGKKINPTGSFKTGLRPITMKELSVYWAQIELGVRSGQIVILDDRKQLVPIEVLKALAGSVSVIAADEASVEHDREIQEILDEHMEFETRPTEPTPPAVVAAVEDRDIPPIPQDDAKVAQELMESSVEEVKETLSTEEDVSFLRACLQAEQNKDKPRKTLITWIEGRMDKVSG